MEALSHLSPTPSPRPLASLSPPARGESEARGAKPGEREKQSLIPESLRELIVTGFVVRENLVKIVGIPLTIRVPSLPESPANTRVQLAIVSIDLLDLNVQTRFIEALHSPLTNSSENDE